MQRVGTLVRVFERDAEVEVQQCLAWAMQEPFAVALGGFGGGSGMGSGGTMSIPPVVPASRGTRNGCRSSAVKFNTRTIRGVSVRMMSVSVVSRLL